MIIIYFSSLFKEKYGSKIADLKNFGLYIQKGTVIKITQPSTKDMSLGVFLHNCLTDLDKLLLTNKALSFGKVRLIDS